MVWRSNIWETGEILPKNLPKLIKVFRWQSKEFTVKCKHTYTYINTQVRLLNTEKKRPSTITTKLEKKESERFPDEKMDSKK